MTQNTRRGREALVAMDDIYQTRPDFVERESGPDRPYSLFRDLCVPLFCLKVLGKTDFDRVLDVGCATGSLTRLFAAFARDVHGLDGTAGAIDIARRRAESQSNIHFQTADIFDVSLEGLFDFIHVREFHPLTRNFYDTEDERKEAHFAIIEKLSKALTPTGYLFVSHVCSKSQGLRGTSLYECDAVEVLISGIDSRIAFLTLPVLRYSSYSITIAKLLSLPIRALFPRRFFEVIVLKRRDQSRSS